ncbi:MAG: TadE/TadG family type IV pilus assembly protein [Alcanivorax sp.]
MVLDKIKQLIKRWKDEEHGLAAIEAAMIFPIMLMLLVGVFDAGNAILANQKTIRASQVVADLITRQNIVSDADINEAIEAGKLAFEPIDSSSYGVDIISIRFDEDANSEIVWRETRNMPPVSNPLSDVSAVQSANEGVVMVSVAYNYEPLFAGFVMTAFGMEERAFSRGRSTPVVLRVP